MAIPWILKQRLRINPNQILPPDVINEEILEFVTSQRRFRTGAIERLAFDEEKLLEYIDTPYMGLILDMAMVNFERYSQETKDIIISKIIELDINPSDIKSSVLQDEKSIERMIDTPYFDNMYDRLFSYWDEYTPEFRKKIVERIIDSNLVDNKVPEYILQALPYSDA